MSDGNRPNNAVSRRTFLTAGIAGCVFCLASMIGCAPDQKEKSPDLQVATRGFVSPIPSPWFSTLEPGELRCELCPRQCILAEGERGLCRVREHRNGALYSLAYGNPALIQEGPIEQKPFFHVRPGSRLLSISTAGCNLACKFCEVWDMALVAPEEVHAYDMPPGTVVSQAGSARLHGICYAFGEPVVFYEYMRDVAELARQAGLMNLIHTAGYIRPEPLRALSGQLDAANVDLKSFDPAFYRDIVGGELEPVLRTLELLCDAGVHIEITNIVIPTLNDDPAMIAEMCRWIVAELGPDVPIHFARFYPLYKLSALPRTSVATLERARNIALDSGLRFAYIAKVTGHEGESTFCPNCGETVIRRVGFVIDEMNMGNGSCGSCGTAIAGRW